MPGKPLSAIASAWGFLLAIVGTLILIVATIGAFLYNVVFGIGWLFVGDPIAATVLYWIGLLLFAPVAAVTHVAGNAQNKTSKGAIATTPCVMSGLLLTDADDPGFLDLRTDGLVFHKGGKRGQYFPWESVDSFGDESVKGLVINVFGGRWMLILDELEGRKRNDWTLECEENGIHRKTAAAS